MESAIWEFRSQISICWNDQTISPKFLPRKSRQANSAGQCTATSYVLARYLSGCYPQQSFTMMVGEVWHKGRKVIPYHVWIVASNFSDPSRSIIIDVTADQSRVLPEVIISTARKLAQNKTQYITYTPVDDLSLVDPATKERAVLLEKIYQNIPR